MATYLLALGPTLYDIIQGTSPYEEVSGYENETQNHSPQRIFPVVSGICRLFHVDSAADDILFRTVDVDSLVP